MRPTGILIFSIIICLTGTAAAATIHGEVYEWSTLEPLNNVIVEINTVPSQSIVVKNGTYSFEIPPGNYTIESRYYKDNLLEYSSSDPITVVDEGDFIFDLIVFPALDVEEFFPVENLSVEEIFEDGTKGSDTGFRLTPFAPPLIAGMLLVIVVLFALNHRTTRRPVISGSLPEDLNRLLSVLEKNGGRMSQKELRKQLDLSEAKVSLMITDLESRGIVKRVKKGRGNIIILNKITGQS